MESPFIAYEETISLLKDALVRITQIELQEFGGDWDEIEEAQQIAKKALEDAE